MLGDGVNYGVRITYSAEPVILGTGALLSHQRGHPLRRRPRRRLPRAQSPGRHGHDGGPRPGL
jgi:hypothetical protein